MVPKKRYSAAEIAHMHLPGLPTTKANVLARAKKESWHYVEQTGLGGKRMLFEIPHKYFMYAALAAIPHARQILNTAQQKPASYIVRKTVQKVVSEEGKETDPMLVEFAVRALDEWIDAREGLSLKAHRKAAITAVLHDYLEKGANKNDVTRLLSVVFDDG